MAANYVPEGFPRVSPYLVVKDTEYLISFARDVFDAELVESIPGNDGKPTHLELKIGDSIIMGGKGSDEGKLCPGMMYIYVEDIDATFKKALDFGAEKIMEPTDMYYGDRNAGVKDINGVQWWFATHFVDLTPEELQKRAKENKR